jgi:hypothetical protein
MNDTLSLNDLRNLYDVITLANEKTIVEVLTAVIDSLSPQDTDNLSTTESKEEQRDEWCILPDPVPCQGFEDALKGNPDACCNLVHRLSEVSRRLKERIMQREDQVEERIVTEYVFWSPAQVEDADKTPLCRLSNQRYQQIEQECKNRRQFAESQ